MAGIFQITGQALIKHRTTDATSPKFDALAYDLALEDIAITQAFHKHFEAFGAQTDFELMTAATLAEAIAIILDCSQAVTLKINEQTTGFPAKSLGPLVTDPSNKYTSLKITNTAPVNFDLILVR